VICPAGSCFVIACNKRDAFAQVSASSEATHLSSAVIPDGAVIGMTFEDGLSPAKPITSPRLAVIMRLIT
jgi:hypothetical protein